ncbi:MAG TPA: hypothetical protein VHY30_06160 [Verrucomicrobiae bacterium]|jgi:hypothetical protein|nr:hypothetical protein [Verrucomicrobiae bacterium]
MKVLKFIRTARLNKIKRLALSRLDKHEQLLLASIDRFQFARDLERIFPAYMPLWNAFQYCGIADLDLSILIYQLMGAETDWRRKLNARVLAMTLFECVDDIPAILAKDFQAGIASLANGHSLMEELDSIRKDLAGFGKKHKNILEEIRHIATAHRDQRADLQMVVIKGINVKMVCELSMEFRGILEKFNNLMAKVFSGLTLKAKSLKSG